MNYGIPSSYKEGRILSYQVVLPGINMGALGGGLPVGKERKQKGGILKEQI